MKFLLFLLGVYEIIYIALMQMIPPELLTAFKDFPLLFIFLGSLYYLMKWLEKMLHSQRVSLKEVYDSNQVFLSELLAQIETKQNKMADRIEILTQQIALINATVSEVAKADDIIERLIERMDRRSGGL
jgi:hypothetical protein